ncbi:GIY-YIG nuclease family protein [Acetobacteraceae bacterium H6797]|nr:GIY-YIG nuclease family protein [Acetobacteraceae bacterium H6797]
MTKDTRKAALRRYKERKAATGIYALRCTASGECWVGRALDLAAIRNQLWFSLRLGTSPFASLQAAWNRHGEAAFSLISVEPHEAAEGETPYLRDKALKARQAHWCAALKASPI